MSKPIRQIAYFVLLIAFLFCESVRAQESILPQQNMATLNSVPNTISVEKKAALNDLADLEISDERRIEFADSISRGLNTAIKAGMYQRVNINTSLSNEQRNELENYRESLTPKIAEDVSKVALMVVTKLNEFVHEQTYQFYGNGLTLEEIVQIVNFYKSQAGQKYLMGKAKYPTSAQLKNGANGPDNYWTQSELSALVEFEKTTASEKIKYLDTHTQVDTNKFTAEKLKPTFVELIGKYQKLIDERIATLISSRSAR